jgi:ABC-type cobalamin/Fe3+-siderophores transport system ATPase subunit
MEYNEYPKGSEWRRWDLHVHTPKSYLNGFPDNWDIYVEELIKAVIKHEIAVIALADYFIIDGYRELLKYYDRATHILSTANGKHSTQVYIIPGIELRLNIFNSSNESINYHILFDPEHCTPDFIKDNFLEKLQVAYRGSNYDLKERNMLAIGHAIVNNVSINLTKDLTHLSPADQQKCFEASYGAVTLIQNDIKAASETIEKIFTEQGLAKKPYVKIIAGKGHGSLKTFKWFDENKVFSRVGLTREDLTNFTDMVFSNDKEDIDFYLGKQAKTPEEEVVKRFGSLKACVWGSDCHDIGKLLHPSNGNTSLYTWIKADPNFEGLKQVMFEPADRVRIQELLPQEKTDYLVIDKVRFVSDLADKTFGNDFIEINENMNAIIGGKSSGKSILLHHIAKTIDPKQVAEKGAVVKEKPYEFDKKIKDFDFEVHWKDGHIDLLSKGPDEKVRQITYVPQLFINHLAEEKGEQKLKELIESILLQNNGFKTLWDFEKSQVQHITTLLTGGITQLYIQRENLKTAIDELKALGDKAAITANIAKTKEEIESLRKTAGFTPEQNTQYEKLAKRKNILFAKIGRDQLFVQQLSDYIEFLEGMKAYAGPAIESELNTIAENLADDDAALRYVNLSSTDVQATNNHFDQLINKHQGMIGAVNRRVGKSELAIDAVGVQLLPFLKLITNQELLTKLLATLAADEAKVKAIAEKEKANQEIIAEGIKTKDAIKDNYDLLHQSYKKILDELQKPELSKISDLELKAMLDFNVSDFTNGFSHMLDNRANFKALFGDFFGDNNEYIFDDAEHSKNLMAIFEKISHPERNNIKFKSGIQSKDAGLKLFGDYFGLKYDIIQNGDNIIDMSPGKRGLVLMQLILHLSNAEHPILIDQPEDNLDNRTIFNELNQFMKDKKLQRQILIVTHNANLVVSTDTEQVIVANQKGQEKGKGNREFQFEYVSGALENTFKKPSENGVLYQMGIREHVCDILEGGEDAFKKREEKYNF